MNTITIRRWHSYIGCFVAPSVLFFSMTGALQLFSLHEAHGKYQPPALIEKLSSVHKDQVFTLGDHHPEANGAAADSAVESAAPAVDHDSDKPAMTTFLLKCFFLIVALCLTFSTLFGLLIGLTQPRPNRIGWLLLAAGALIPMGLLLV